MLFNKIENIYGGLIIKGDFFRLLLFLKHRMNMGTYIGSDIIKTDSGRLKLCIEKTILIKKKKKIKRGKDDNNI